MESCQASMSYSKELDIINAKGIRVFPIVEFWFFIWIPVGVWLAPFDTATTCWEYAAEPMASCFGKAIGRFVFRFSEHSGLEL